MPTRTIPLAVAGRGLPDMNNGRWYPTNTTLPTGDVLVTSGWIDTQTGVNVEPQVWQTATSSWRNLTAAHLALPFYPFMFVAPNGKVFCAGPSQTSRYLDTSGSGAWSVVANSNYGVRNWGSAVMYDTGKILMMGGSPCGFYSDSCTTTPTATAEIIDLTAANPTWQYTAPMAGPRKLHNATLLPDGKVLVTGGSRGTEDPNTESAESSLCIGNVGPCHGQLVYDGEFKCFPSIPCYGAAVTRRARFMRGRARTALVRLQPKSIRRRTFSREPVQLSRRRPRALRTGSRFLSAHLMRQA